MVNVGVENFPTAADLVAKLNKYLRPAILFGLDTIKTPPKLFLSGFFIIKDEEGRFTVWVSFIPGSSGGWKNQIDALIISRGILLPPHLIEFDNDVPETCQNIIRQVYRGGFVILSLVSSHFCRFCFRNEWRF